MIHYKGRVGFMGTHSTGKTSVAKKLTTCAEGMHMQYVGGHARAIQQQGGSINEQATIESQSQIMHDLCSDILSSAFIVSDRTPIDVLAYTRQVDDVDLVSAEYLGIESMARFTIKHYDHLFMFPMLGTVKDDGLRSTSEDFRNTINQEILKLIKTMNVEVTYLNAGNISQLTRQVKKELMRY